jgi:ABC-2 type transport system permease protein
MIAAILRAQAIGMRMGKRRGAALSALVAVLWYGMWAGVACAVFAMAYVAQPSALREYAPLGFLAVFVYWQVAPVVTANLGSALDTRKLLAYPIAHRKLFLVDLLLRLTGAGEMVMVLGAGLFGMLANPAAGNGRIWPRAVLAVLLYLAFNLLLASGTRSLLERLLSRRGVREAVVLGMLLLWVAPRLVMVSGYRPTWLGGGAAALGAAPWPWGAASRASLAGGSGGLALVTLGAWMAAAGWFGRGQFERGLRFDAAAAQARPSEGNARREGALERFYRFPAWIWRDPLAGLVEKELRSLARTPRFRTVFIMGFTFGLVVWLPMALRPHHGDPGAVERNFLTVVSLYALTLLGQVSYWNCFGMDRSAARIYFTIPQPISRALVSKNIASLVYIYVEVLLLTAIVAALHLVDGWGQVLETLVVVGICAAYLMALGNLASVYYPRALKPERVSGGGTSSRFQGLIFLLYPIALLPVALAYLARYALDSQAAFAAVLAVAAAIGAALYWVALDSAVLAAGRRREALIEELAKGDGPVDTD